MALSNRLLMGCASLSMVFAIGFVMQNGASSQNTKTEVAVQMPAAQDRIDLSEITLTVGSPDPAETSAVILPVTPEPELTRVASAAPLEIETQPEAPLLQQPQLSCEPQMTLEVQPAAMVRLQIAAPCLMNQRVTLHHNGMMFTALTDLDGALDIVVPVLAETAVFIADFGNGEGAVAHAQVPDLALFDRAVAQWQGELGLQLHALEYGASYGEIGHVWSGAPGVAAAALQGLAGFHSRLGDSTLPEGYRAEVYTFPTSSAPYAGEVLLSVETELTAQNCTRDIQAESLQLLGGRELEVRELSLTMPGCDMLGDFLVLNNLLQDLKIAAK